MERIMRYRRLVREGRNCFSMYNDDVGRIQFEEKIITQEQIVRLLYGKSIKEHREAHVFLDDLEDWLESFQSYQYIFFYCLSDTLVEVLRVLNRRSVAANCFAPIIVFNNSVIIFPKLRHSYKIFLEQLLKNRTDVYGILWVSILGG